MAQNSIEKMLEISTRIEKGNTTSTKGAVNGHKVANQQDLDRLIENYDQQVYGASVEPVLKQDETPKYDARKEMEKLKEIEAHGGRGVVNLEGRNIPRGIIESILNNPLDLKPIDPRMDALEEKLKDKMTGIKAATNILEKVEKQDKEAKAKLREQLQPKQTLANNIDYELIKVTIEEAIDKKLESLKQTINEANNHQQTYIPSMKYLSFKDKFYFVDNDDNVFECVMKYKGKRKK